MTRDFEQNDIKKMSEKSGLMQQLVHTPLAAYAHPMQTPLFPYEHPPELRYLPTHALSNHRC